MSVSTSQVTELNLKNLMETVDDAWNAGPQSSLWDTFKKRHTEDVVVYWPGQPEPTRGRHSHDMEAVEFFKIFPDNHLINRPYKILFAEGNHTCSVADFYGTNEGSHEDARWKDNSGLWKGLSRRILHGSILEQQRGNY